MNGDNSYNKLYSKDWERFLSHISKGKVRNQITQLLERGDLDPNSTTENGQTPLSWAAGVGKNWLVELLLKRRDIDVNKTDKYGQTPLFCAVEHAQEEATKLLLGHDDINPNFLDVHGQTPLVRAVKYGHKTIVTLLLETVAIKADYKDRDGCTPLMHAVGCLAKSKKIKSRSNQSEVAILLLENPSVDPDSVDNQDRTPLSRAAERGNAEITELLLRNRRIDQNRIDSSGRTPLSWASECGHEIIVKLLLDYKSVNPDIVDDDGRTPLWRAAEHEHMAVVRTLLETKKVNSNHQDRNGRTQLSWAAERGMGVTVNLLLGYRGTNPNLADRYGRTPLFWAAEAEQHESLTLLLKHKGIKPNSLDQDGRTPLSQAAEHGHDRIVMILLKQDGVEPDQKDKCGRTPLSWAMCSSSKGSNSSPGISKRLRVVELLLEHAGVDPNVKDNEGRAPLWWAAHGNHKAMVELLLEKRDIDPAPLTQDGQTPLAHAVELEQNAIVEQLVLKDSCTLHILVRKGNCSLVKSLLQSKYKVDAKDNLNQTPLHVAASTGHLDIAKQLILWGANINHQDIYGMTPLRLAVRHRRPDLIEMLLHRGAQTIGIMADEWREAYKPKLFYVGLELLQMSDDTASLHFPGHIKPMLAESGKTRRLVLLSDYSAWLCCLGSNATAVPQSDKSPITRQIWMNAELLNIAVSGCFPICQSPRNLQSFRLSDWGKYGISWTMTPPTAAQSQPTWQSIDHFSTLPYGWIPENGTDFFALFVKFLKEQWLKTCLQAEEYMTERRFDQLCEKGNSLKLIHDLAEDAKRWAQLRSILLIQIREVNDLATEYHHRSNQSRIPQLLRQEIDSFDAEVSNQISQLEQTVKDLLHFEFAWVTINEAHRSTSIATSIKRLSWITFIFLPAMFASSLFGMNVDVLENNPDWRWYIVFGLGFIAVTFSVWLIIKYSQLEGIVEQNIGEGLQRLSDRLKATARTLPTQEEDAHQRDY